jgi:hypothetical protein
MAKSPRRESRIQVATLHCELKVSFLQRDAYNNPEVETSDEPFNWGFPDLNGLRG